MYQFITPNVTGPDGKANGAGAIVPHATNIGISTDAVTYPDGFQSQLSGAVSEQASYLISFSSAWL